MMKQLLVAALLFSGTFVHAQGNSLKPVTKASPLATYSSDWNDPAYKKCNTAANIPYLSPREKELIYILNLVRTNPALFARSVLKQYPRRTGRLYLEEDSFYFQSLMDTLLTLPQQPLLYANKDCFTSAFCHASSSGVLGYVGHIRQTDNCKKKQGYNGECCEYGNSEPLYIILNLLIDEGVPSLGHRMICLGSYNKIGVSIQPHKAYGKNTVLDFKF